MGSLVKNHLANNKGLSAEQIYHITLMPCYDKKLEASREDFYNSLIQSKDVDCVITASMYYHHSYFKFKVNNFILQFH
jgi:iron only hydrogenase large subunit-like protein